MASWSVDNAKICLIALAAMTAVMLAAVAFSLRGSALESARDFEECVEALGANQPSRSSGKMAVCAARFAGRRKPGGGYTYFDFMQNRNFDIIGPNPTAEERKHFDHEYIAFLDAQRREAVSAELIKKRDEQLRADLDSARQPTGQPLALTPKKALSLSVKRQADRPKPVTCGDNSLACGWSKLSAAVKDAFASSPTPRR